MMGTGPCRSGNLFKSHFLRGGKPLQYIPHVEDRNTRILVSGIFAMRVTVPSLSTLSHSIWLINSSYLVWLVTYFPGMRAVFHQEPAIRV